jgi:hypothetical protein
MVLAATVTVALPLNRTLPLLLRASILRLPVPTGEVTVWGFTQMEAAWVWLAVKVPTVTVARIAATLVGTSLGVRLADVAFAPWGHAN